MKSHSQFQIIWLCMSFVICAGFPATAQDMVIQKPIFQLAVESASAVVWSPEGDRLAVRNHEGVMLFTDELEFIQLIEQPSQQIKTLSWSPNGNFIAAVGSDHDILESKVYIWDAQATELLTIFEGHRSHIPSLAWSPDSSQIASGSWDRSIQIWDPLTEEVYHTLSIEIENRGDTYASEIFSISWSPDESLIAGVVSIAGIFIWHTETGEVVLALREEDTRPPNPYEVTWSPDGMKLATEHNILWASDGEEIIAFDECSISVDYAWHPDSRHLAILSRQDLLYICDTTNDKVVAIFEGGVSHEETTFAYLNALDWHPDGKRLAGAAGDGFVRIWDVSPLLDNESE